MSKEKNGLYPTWPRTDVRAIAGELLYALLVFNDAPVATVCAKVGISLEMLGTVLESDEGPMLLNMRPTLAAELEAEKRLRGSPS
jgi:hypothetical protein